MTLRFISFEGIDGAGKSTHIEWCAQQLRDGGHQVVLTREPGGSPLAEQIREVVLGQEMSAMTELLMIFAARADHIATCIQPALDAGHWVIADRFVDSTTAYQGGGREMDTQIIENLIRVVAGACLPRRTYLFDLPPALAKERREVARPADRFEAEQAAFFERVRAAYLGLARREPDRIKVIDSSLVVPEIRASLGQDLQSLIATASDE